MMPCDSAMRASRLGIASIRFRMFSQSSTAEVGHRFGSMLMLSSMRGSAAS